MENRFFRVLDCSPAFVQHAVLLLARDGHAFDAQRGAGGGGAEFKIIADFCDVREHVGHVEIGSGYRALDCKVQI